VEWQAERLFLRSTVLDKVSLTARLEDGRLEVKPFAADHFGEHIVGALNIDTQGGEPTLTAIGGPLAHLIETPQAWPIALSAQAPTFTAGVKGTVAPPWNRPGLDLAVTLKGTQLHTLSTMFQTDRPYESTGQVTLAMTALRPRLTGTLTSKSLVLDQLIDTNPSTPVPGKPAPPLDFEIPIEELKRIDADLSWHVSNLILRAKPLGDFGLTVELRDGRLHAAPVQSLLSGGTIRANLDVDGSRVPPTASLTATGRKIDYGRLTRVLGITERIAGNADFDIALAGTGASFQGWLRQGSLSLATGPTTITIHDQHQGPDLQFEIGKATAASKEGGPVQTKAEGIFRAQHVAISATGGTVAGLIAHQGTWPLAVATQTAGASIDLKGELRLPLDGNNFLFQAHLKGDRLKDLDPILNQQLPALGSYEFTGTLADTKTGYRLTNMAGCRWHRSTQTYWAAS
jgi:hypothetical protein